MKKKLGCLVVLGFLVSSGVAPHRAVACWHVLFVTGYVRMGKEQSPCLAQMAGDGDNEEVAFVALWALAIG